MCYYWTFSNVSQSLPNPEFASILVNLDIYLYLYLNWECSFTSLPSHLFAFSNGATPLRGKKKSFLQKKKNWQPQKKPPADPIRTGLEQIIICT